MNVPQSTPNWDQFTNENKGQTKNNIPTVRMLDATDWRGSFPRTRQSNGPLITVSKNGVLRINKAAIDFMEITPEMQWLEMVLLEHNDNRNRFLGISPKIQQVAERSARIGWDKDKKYIAISAKTFFKQKKLQLPKEPMRFVPQQLYVKGFGIYYAIDLSKPKIDE